MTPYLKGTRTTRTILEDARNDAYQAKDRDRDIWRWYPFQAYNLIPHRFAIAVALMHQNSVMMGGLWLEER